MNPLTNQIELNLHPSIHVPVRTPREGAIGIAKHCFGSPAPRGTDVRARAPELKTFHPSGSLQSPEPMLWPLEAARLPFAGDHDGSAQVPALSDERRQVP